MGSGQQAAYDEARENRYDWEVEQGKKFKAAIDSLKDHRLYEILTQTQTDLKKIIDNATMTRMQFNTLQNIECLLVELTQIPKFRLTVNGVPKDVEGRELSYDDVVELAGYIPRPGFTITVQDGPRGESLCSGGKTILRQRMAFNVAMTNNA